MACPSCGRPLPEGAQFCPACGHSLRPGALEERRVVTVLFADLVGFTTLAERADPERVKRLVDGAFQQLVHDIERFGGTVDKLLGDAVVALFGAPVAHEDDAERAVRAGLQMHQSLREFVARQPVDLGAAALSMRVGINTGEVLVGTVAGTDYTAMGDVVNTASRLEALAQPGEVMVGDTTRSLCSDAVRFEPLEPMRLRGREQLEQIWRALDVDDSARPRRRSAATPFVGRGAERQLVSAVVDLALDGRAAVVSVTGEAGIGKSRLVDEVLAEVRQRNADLVVIEGSCSPYADSNVWAPISSGIATLYGVERGQPPDEVRALLQRHAARDLGADAAAPAVQQEVEAFLHLLGHPSALDRLDPAGARDVLFGTVVGGVRRRAARAPVVIWIDDLHWAHALLLDLLGVVARSVTGLPVLIITAARPPDDPGVVASWPTSADRSVVFQLSLDPLDHDESTLLLERMTAGRVGPDLLGRIIERAGGNPLFLTELAQLAMTSDEQVDELPGSLRALIAARLDQLGVTERAVIDNASILGAEGRVLALEEFAAAMGQPWDPAHLDPLVATGLLESDGEWWRFRSDVIREVAYQTLTKQSRAQRHAGVATVMAGYELASVDELAHHAATAAELVHELGPVPGVSREIRTTAVDLLARAARRSYDVGGFRHGVALAERALALGGELPELQCRLLLLRAEGLVEIRRSADARGDLGEVLRLLPGVPGDALARAAEGDARRLLGTLEQQDGDLVAARRELGRAVEIFRELDDDARLAVALRERGFAEVFGGSLQDAEWYLGEADAIHERLGDARGRAWVAQHQAWVSFLSGAHREAEERLLDAIVTFERLGDHSGVTWTRGLLAFVLYFQRRFDEADAMAGSVLVEARRWDDDWGASMMLTLIANLRLWTGRFADAVQHAERALVGFRQLGDQFGFMLATAPLSRARVALGRVNEAERGVEEILAASDSFGGLSFPSLAASGVTMHLGDGPRTVVLASEAVTRMAETGSNSDEAQVQLAVGHLQCGRPDEALAALERVLSEDSPFMLSVRALVRLGAGDPVGALADADRVTQLPEPSYFDRALAALAGAAAAARLDSVDRSTRATALWSVAGATGDVVVGALLRAGAARLTSQIGAETSLPAGWQRILDLAVPPELGTSDRDR